MTNGGVCVGAWNFPLASTYTPPPITIAPGNQASSVGGDQCLRCHRNDTQWNSNAGRYVDSYLLTGHKNMARKVPNSVQIDRRTDPARLATRGRAPARSTAATYTTQLTCTAAGFTWNSTTSACTAPTRPTPGQRLRLAARPHHGRRGPDARLLDLRRLVRVAVCSRPRSTRPRRAAASPRSRTPAGAATRRAGRATRSSARSTGNLAKEPEKSFPGVSLGRRTGHATNGQVNLAGGVAGDANGVSSWDLFGISCYKCHGVAVDNTRAAFRIGTAAGYGGLHNNGFTGTSSASGNGPDAGYCSLPNFSAAASCTATGGTCLHRLQRRRLPDAGRCVAAGKTWTYASCSTNDPTKTVGAAVTVAASRRPTARRPRRRSSTRRNARRPAERGRRASAPSLPRPRPLWRGGARWRLDGRQSPSASSATFPTRPF